MISRPPLRRLLSSSGSLVLLIGVVFAPTKLRAAQRVWEGNVSGDLTDGANFVGGVAPGVSGDGIAFNAAGSAGTVLFQNISRNYGDAAGALLFNSGASSYTIGGTGAITVSTGSIVNNSGVLQTINNNLIRNTGSNLTIGASGGILDFNGTYDVRASNLSQFAFGSTQGGIIAFNGGLINSGAAGTYTLTLPNLTAPAFGTVVIGGTNSGVTGNVTLGSNTRLKLTSASAVNVGQNIALFSASGGGNDVLWLASNSALNAFNLTGTDAQAAKHTVILGTGNTGAAVAQELASLRLSPQHLIDFTRAGNVVSGTPGVTVTGTTTLGGDGTSGRAAILAANGVNVTLGAVTSTSATNQVVFVLDGNTAGSAIRGVIDNGAGGGVSVSKAGSGTWTLSAANTYLGATSVNNGTLRLDFNASGAPTSDILYNGVTAGSVSLGGGTLRMEGRNGAASTQTLGGLSTVGSTGASEIVLRAGTGGGSSMNATVTGLTLNIGSTLNFDIGANTNFRNSAISAAAFVGQGAFFNNGNYARYDASGNVIEAVNANFSTGASVLAGNAGSTSSYFFLDGGQTRTVGLSFKGLRIGNTANSQTLDLAGTTQTFSNSSIIYRGGNDNNYTISNGTISGLATNLIVQVVDGATLTIAGDVNLGGGLGASFTKSGNGTLVVDGAKNFTGRWNVTDGVLSINSIANGGANSGLGASTNAAANLYLYGGTLRYTGAAASTDRSFTIGSGGAVIEASGTGALTWAPAAAIAYGFNTNNTANTTTSAQNQRITFGGTSTADNTFGSASGILADPSNVGRLQVVKEGTGRWILNQANTYTGGTQINGGTLAIANNNALGTIGSVTFGGGTLQYGSGISADISHRVQHSNSAIRIDTNGNNVTFQSRLDETNTGGLTKLGTGTLALNNSNLYTGVTNVTAGTLLLGVGGSIHASSGILIADGAILDTSAKANGIEVVSDQFIGGDGAINGDLSMLAGAEFVFSLTETLTVSGTVSLSNSFGVNSLVTSTGGAIDWSSVALGTYTLIANTGSFGNILNFGAANAQALGGGKSAYFQNGSLQLVVVPEPSTTGMLAAGMTILAALRRRRRSV
ncbi:MAG: autotransporter-associated beta strand repeat-containing protein [Terrimicrobiaceae bacterium]|nr:autotransporter-associated beta strand repeat-containing protein [Terrimicrobiaceae bacterium]